ncbi:MAG: PIG-L deacetylase family protein [Chitinophagales bacterium]
MKQKKFLATIMLVFLLSFFSIETVSAQPTGKPQKCIMVFGAHADDVESIAGGTLAKYIAMGYKGIYVGTINNLAGCSLEKTPYFNGAPLFTISNSPRKYPVDALETSQIRQEEALQAAEVFGATPIFLDFREPWFSMGRKQIDYGTIQYQQFSPPGRKLISIATIVSADVDVVCELLRKYQPEIVITHTLGGEKLDHGNTAYLVYLAFKRVMKEKMPLGKLWMPVRGWFSETAAQKNGRGKPDIGIDVKEYLPIKYAAYDKHISQNGGFGRDYVLSNKRGPYNDQVEEFITVIDITR